MLTVGIFALNLWPGTEVYDKATGGELVKEGVFKVGDDEYETDAEGKIVETESSKAKLKSDNGPAESDFVNPFTPGVSYKDFLAALGKDTVEEYCTGKITETEIEWLVADLKHYKK